MDRRQLIAGATALSLFGSREAAAQALRPSFMPVEVRINAGIPANELHVIPDSFMLYWTQPGGRAMRYMVCGSGRPGLYEAGEFFVGAKKEWPSWTPTPDMMIERDPAAYKEFEDGMPGGPDNPLGAPRALSLRAGTGRYVPADPRHERAGHDRYGGVERMRAPRQ